MAVERGASPAPWQTAISELARSQHGVVTRAQALSLGMSPAAISRAVRRGKWERIHGGVYCFVAAPRTWHQAIVAADRWAGDGCWMSHRAAGALWELEGVEAGWVELASSRRLRAPHGIIVHYTCDLPPCDVTELRGVHVTNATRTLFDLSSVLPAGRVEAALDHALRTGLTSMPRLKWTMERLGHSGRAGVSVLRPLIWERSGGLPVTESALEARLSTLLRGAGLPPLQRQFVVTDRSRFVARLDFADPDLRVGIEVDGWRHHSGLRAWRRDVERNNRLMGLGWRIFHLTWEHIVQRPDEAIKRIQALVRSRA